MSQSALIHLRSRKGEVVDMAVVDRDMYGYLNQWTWRLHKSGYAYRGEKRDGKYRIYWMARVIMGLEPGDPLTVDHRNRVRLDNTRANLRITTRAENNQNLPSHRDSTSRYRGVCRKSDRPGWLARVTVGGVTINVGQFDTEIEAALAAARIRAQHMPFSEEAAA